MKMVSQAVGSENMAKYVSVIDWALKTDRAAAVLSASTYPEGTYSAYQCVFLSKLYCSVHLNPNYRGNDFVRKYHWPNGVSPSATSLVNEFLSVCKGRFSLDSVEDFGTRKPLSFSYPCGLIPILLYR